MAHSFQAGKIGYDPEIRPQNTLALRMLYVYTVAESLFLSVRRYTEVRGGPRSSAEVYGGPPQQRMYVEPGLVVRTGKQ